MPADFISSSRSINLPSGKTLTIAPPSQVSSVQGKRKDDEKWWLLLLLITAADIKKADAFWRLHSRPSFAGLLGHTNGFGFDELSQQYTKNGKPQDDGDRRAIFAAFLLAATADMERQAGRMARGRIPLDQWQESQAQAVKSLYIAADAFGRGGVEFVDPVTTPPATPAPITDKVPTDLPGALGDATARLKRFGVSLEQGDAGSVTAIIRRAGLYAGPAHGVMEKARLESHDEATDANDVKIEWEYSNQLDDGAEHCKNSEYAMGCPEVSDLGWQPIFSMPDISDRSCKSHCRCSWAFRVAQPKKLDDAKESDFKSLGSLGLSAGDYWLIRLSSGRDMVVPIPLQSTALTPA
jgi:hypothetical protein